MGSKVTVLETQKILILFGGASSEHDASCAAFSYLYEVLSEPSHSDERSIAGVAYVDPSGRCFLSEPTSARSSAQDYADTENERSVLEVIELARRSNWFVFSLLYGRQGEDGSLQGALELAGVASNAAGIFSSALAMDKFLMGQVFTRVASSKVTVPRTVVVRHPEEVRNALDAMLPAQCIVKPNRLGSSVFTEVVSSTDRESYEQAAILVDRILEFDRSALVQEYVAGTEYSIGLIERGGRFDVLPPVRIEPSSAVFDQREKFTVAQATETVVPDFDKNEALYAAAKEFASIAWFLGFRNIARVDVIVSDKGTVALLEFNVVPGLLRRSLLTKMFAAAGVHVWDFIDQCGQNHAEHQVSNFELHFPVDA